MASEVNNVKAKILFSNLKKREIESLSIVIKAKDIKSGIKLMDKDTYKALKADKHPIITFTLNKDEFSGEKENSNIRKLTRNLTVAGVTKFISVITAIKINSKRNSWVKNDRF